MNSRLVLVSLGKDSKIIDLVKLIGTEEEKSLLTILAKKFKTPVYKSETCASQEEKDAFLKYAAWLASKLNEGII